MGMGLGGIGRLGRMGIPAPGKGVGVSLPFYDFTAGLPAPFTMRTSGGGAARLRRTSSAKWAQVAWGSPRLHHDEVGAVLGTLFERAHTSKCRFGTNQASAPVDASGSFNVTPVSVSRIAGSVDLGTNLDGFEDLITAALRVDNAASGVALTQQIDTTTGNTNKHSIQGLTRDASGAGGTYSGVQMSGGGSVIGPAGPGFWDHVVQEDMTPTSSARIAQIVTRANRVQDVGLILLTETRYAPTPYLVPTDNVAPIIGDEYTDAPVVALLEWNTTEVAFAFEWYHEWPFSVDNEPVFAIAKASSPTTDYVRIVGMADGTMKADMVVGGATVFSMTFAAPTRRTVCRAVVRLKGGSFLAAINGAAGTVDTDAGDWSGFDTAYINRLNGSYSNFIARSLELTNVPVDDAGIAAASAGGGGFS